MVVDWDYSWRRGGQEDPESMVSADQNLQISVSYPWGFSPAFLHYESTHIQKLTDFPGRYMVSFTVYPRTTNLKLSGLQLKMDKSSEIPKNKVNRTTASKTSNETACWGS